MHGFGALLTLALFSQWEIPIDQVFPELPDVAAIVGQVFASGEPFGATAYKAHIVLGDEGFAKEAHWDWPLVPLKNQDNPICAVLHIALESTASVLLECRMTTLNALAKQAIKGTSTEGVCHAMIAALGDVPDISWLSIYAQNGDGVKQPDQDLSCRSSAQGQEKTPSDRQTVKQHFRLVGTTFDRINRAGTVIGAEVSGEASTRSRLRRRARTLIL